jgi:hypothetical protein
MYKTDFVCTYKSFEELDDDEVTADMLYQAQFLQVFGLTQYDAVAINAGLEAIKAKAAEIPELKALILQHPYNRAPEQAEQAEQAESEDDPLPLLFAYPTMDVFHLCLIDAFTRGRISQERRDKLLHAYSTLH